MSYAQVVKANYHALEKRRIDELLDQLTSMGAIKKMVGKAGLVFVAT